MQNLPRIFINEPLESGKQIPISKDQLHYLQKVMRTEKCLVFNAGKEFNAQVAGSQLSVLDLTEHPDPSNNLIFAFAPIKQSRMEEMLNAATQMGVARLQPVITERTTERFPKWERIRKIIIEASEQSGRNSVPELLPPIKFSEFVGANENSPGNLIFADERFAHEVFPSCGGVDASEVSRRGGSCNMRELNEPPRPAGTPPQEGNRDPTTVLIGPEGGFSPAEFSALDASDAIGISLGKTILRAETAAIAALAKIID